MKNITKIKTKNHEEWLALRKNYIGGSDAAAVIGLNPNVSPYRLWAEKTNKIPEFTGNLATEVGTYLEEFVAKKFEAETGKKVRRTNQSIINDTYPFAIANIDRVVCGESSGLEIKTTSELNLKKFKSGEYPYNYYCQCVHYLAVTGAQRWYLAVLIGNREFRWFVIDRDEEEIDALMDAERKFFELIKNDVPPAVDGTKSTSDVINAIYGGRKKDESIDITKYDEVVSQYLAINRQIKDLNIQKAGCENIIKAYMAESKVGESAKYHVSWLEQTRRKCNINRFIEEHPTENLSRYYDDKNISVFRVKEK